MSLGDASVENSTGERFGESLAVRAEGARLGHRREDRADLIDERAKVRWWLVPGDVERLRCERGEPGEGGVEAAPNGGPLAPGEEAPRGDVVLAKAAEREKRRRGDRARLLGPPVLHHVQRLHRPLVVGDERRGDRVLEQVV